MKKLLKNKIWFSIFMVVVLFAFMFITNGFGGIIPDWHGFIYPLTKFIVELINTTTYGLSAVNEFLWIVALLPVILIFKNKYVFTQKAKSFADSIKLAWIILLIPVFYIISGTLGNGLNHINYKEVIVLVIFTALIGVFEELTCRGWILNEFLERFGKSRKDIIFSIIMSSVVFGALHIMNFVEGQDLVATIGQMINAVSMGLILGCLYYRTKNIWACMFVHAFWDFGLFFTQINEANNCITTSPEFKGIGVLFVLIALAIEMLPQIFNSILLLNRYSLNKDLPKSAKYNLSEREIKDSKNNYRLFVVFSIIYLAFYGFIIVFNNKQFGTSNSCPAYQYQELSNYAEKTPYVDKYEFAVSNIETDKYLNNCDGDVTNEDEINCPEGIVTSILDYKLDGKKLIIEDTYNKIKVKVSDEVLDILLLSHKDKTEFIYVTKDKDGNYIAHRAIKNNYLDDETNEQYINNIAKSFEIVKIPDFNDLAILEDGGHEYPLFIAKNGRRYFLDNTKNIYYYTK